MRTSHTDRGRGLLLALALLAAAPGPPAFGGDLEAEEYKVKAAFLFNFVKFVDWPEAAFADAYAPVVLAVLGDDPFGDSLDKLQGRTVKGRPVAIRRAASLKALGRFHVLFVSSAERFDLVSVLSAAEAMGALTVGDARGFRKMGGAIELVRSDDRIAFEVNLDAARRARLKISSKLLGLAKVVSGENG
jgi:hypothetical protein